MTIRNKGKKNKALRQSFTGMSVIFIKILIAVVAIAAFVTVFVNAPSSNSYFTGRTQTGTYRIDF